jgi:hypothetical protein
MVRREASRLGEQELHGGAANALTPLQKEMMKS